MSIISTSARWREEDCGAEGSEGYFPSVLVSTIPWKDTSEHLHSKITIHVLSTLGTGKEMQLSFDYWPFASIRDRITFINMMNSNIPLLINTASRELGP